MRNNQTMSRRSFLKIMKKQTIGLLGLTAMASYPILGERFWYQVNHVQLSLAKLPLSFVGWKVVQLSDIHLGFHYYVRNFRRVARIVNDLKPDIIFFTGDLVHRDSRDIEQLVPALQLLQADRGGKWAVLGNHDFTLKQEVIQTLEAGRFQVLQNNHGYISHNGQRLYIAGINDVLFDDWNIKGAVQGLTQRDCVLLLAHEPDIARLSAKEGISAQFSGHSHGGQVRIPFVGPIFTPDLAQLYIDGLYIVGNEQMPLYVNRGIGCTHLPIRFWCRPEITVFHLEKA